MQKCSAIEDHEMKKDFTLNDVLDLSLAFSGLLINAEYSQARQLLTADAAEQWSSDELADAWTAMLRGGGEGELIAETIAVDAMEGWPEREYLDVGWAYVPVLNEVVNEAITLIATTTGDGLRIRYLEFGRPPEV